MGMGRLAGFPFIMQGTSKGSSCSIWAMAATSALRSADPGAYVLCSAMRSQLLIGLVDRRSQTPTYHGLIFDGRHSESCELRGGHDCR